MQEPHPLFAEYALKLFLSIALVSIADEP